MKKVFFITLLSLVLSTTASYADADRETCKRVSIDLVNFCTYEDQSGNFRWGPYDRCIRRNLPVVRYYCSYDYGIAPKAGGFSKMLKKKGVSKIQGR